MNKGAEMLVRPMQALGSLLAQVAERAAELNDPKLNHLMCRLTLFTIADPASPDYNQERLDSIKSLAEASDNVGQVVIDNAITADAEQPSPDYAELIEWFLPASTLPDADTTVLIIAAGDVEAWVGYLDGDEWRDAVDGMPIENVVYWAHIPEGPAK